MKTLSSLLCAAIIACMPLILNAQTLEPNAAASEAQNLVYINKADESALQTLKGVGKSKAQAIIAFRDEYGEFKSPEDLLKVKGIGQKILLDNAQRIKI